MTCNDLGSIKEINHLASAAAPDVLRYLVIAVAGKNWPKAAPAYENKPDFWLFVKQIFFEMLKYSYSQSN
jgi:hypothetical protein